MPVRVSVAPDDIMTRCESGFSGFSLSCFLKTVAESVSPELLHKATTAETRAAGHAAPARLCVDIAPILSVIDVVAWDIMQGRTKGTNEEEESVLSVDLVSNGKQGAWASDASCSTCSARLLSSVALQGN